MIVISIVLLIKSHLYKELVCMQILLYSPCFFQAYFIFKVIVLLAQP